MEMSMVARRMRLGPATVAIGLTLAVGDPGHAAGVFLPAGMPAPASQATPASAEEVRQTRFVRIAHSDLQRARAEVGDFGRSRLLLNVSERVAFEVEVERIAQTLDGYTLSGNVDGGKGGFVTLAVHREAVAGSIWTWGASYEVVPIGNGVHAVRQVVDAPLDCGVVVPEPSTELNAPALTNGASSEPAVVDILIFWTPALEAARGGESHVKLAIDLAMAYANDALERSGALVSLSLVGAEQLDIPDGNTNRVPEELYTSERADALGADFVSAFVVGHGGGARTMNGYPASVVGNGSPYVFTHEVGHNLGLHHDRGTETAPGYSYNVGYVSIATQYTMTRCDRTIMAYSTACRNAGLDYSRRLPYYSTPNRYHAVTGTPLGVSRLTKVRGPDGAADAVFAINQNRHRSSEVRPRRSAR